LFKTFALASVIGLGLWLPGPSASAASLGALPAVALEDRGAVAKAQFWDDEPSYGYRRPYYEDDYRPRRRYGPPAYGPPAYGPRAYGRPTYDERPRYQRPRGRDNVARGRAVAPRTGCYTPPPMPYRTPRVVCRY
jgi:hypothetical protein